MAFLGLLLIAVAWFLQYRTASQTLDKTFLLLYIGGSFLLVVDNLSFERLSIAGLNLLIGVFAILVLRKKPSRKRR